jgi:tight adherence protein C
MELTTIVIIGIAALVLVGGTVAVVLGLRARGAGGGGDIQMRLEEYASRGIPFTLEELELSQPFAQRVIRPLLISMAERASQMSPAKSKLEAERQMALAGKPYGWGAKEFMALRMVMMVILGLLTFLIAMVSSGILAAFGAALGGAMFGFVLPLIWLRSKISNRKGQIIKALPDAMDLLTITVEAGMGFDGAMQKVAEKWDNELSRAFGKVVQEMRLGVLRRDALKNMDATMEVPDITSFVAAIVQADQLGVSIAKILRVQSEQMRMKRRQRAEAAANKAPIKMLFPMVFLIFPALFIVLLGPASLIAMETFATPK